MFTNSTPNYGLPQWIATDKPAWIGDMNVAFGTIDTQLKNANDNSSGASSVAQALQGRVTSVENNITTISAEVSEQANTLAELETDVQDLKDTDQAVQTNVTTLFALANEEVVNLNALRWVASSVDPRYPYQISVAVTKAHTKPQAYPYGGSGLVSALEYGIIDTIEQFVYDSDSNTITFYSTLSTIENITDVNLVIKG